jgi:hypothetical protein
MGFHFLPGPQWYITQLSVVWLKIWFILVAKAIIKFHPLVVEIKKHERQKEYCN